MSKYLKILNKIKSPTFTAKEAYNLGVSRQRLASYVSAQKLVRLSTGVYAFPENVRYDLDDILIGIHKAIPNGVFGYETALQLLNLSETPSYEIHLIVPTNRLPTRKLDDVVIHQVKQDYYRLGVSKVKSLPVTCLERTMIDMLRSQRPLASVINIWLTSQRLGFSIDISKLERYAKVMRSKQKLERLLEAIP